MKIFNAALPSILVLLLGANLSALHAQTLPTSFSWTSTGPLISPKSDSTHDMIAVKDPSTVFYNNQYIVYASSVNSAGNYGMEYLSFPNWSSAGAATPYFMDNTPGFSGYHTAPQVFYFAPQKKWYLIFQSGQPQYSTNSDPTQPKNWTTPTNFFASQPSSVSNWIDFWIISDSSNVYLFFCGDNGNFYRSSTSLANFPNGFNTPVIIYTDSEFNLFEADNVYTVEQTGTYLADVECIGSDGHRFFRALSAPTLGGTWTPLGNTASLNTPFLGAHNVTFQSGVSSWTSDFSSGGAVIDGYDSTDSINLNNLTFLYQGDVPNSDSYNLIPWQLALVTSKANTSSTPTATFTHTNTPVPPTATFTPTKTNTPTATYTYTFTHTNTPVPPTATFTFTPTKTNTPVPPTATNTFTFTSTNTAVPPTATFTWTATSTPCSATAITPYLQVNGGAWAEENAVTVASLPATVNLGPQPLTGGSWSWSGPNGFTSTSREIDAIPLSVGTNTFTATYTNGCGLNSTETFTVVVSAPATPTYTFSFTNTNTAVPPTATGTNTPVPPTATNTNSPVPPTVTNTPAPPTSTNTPAPPTMTRTETPVPPTATNTNSPVPPTVTNTQAPPTVTNTPVPPTATGTNTPVPPTATFTNTFTHTNTPVPPTATFTFTNTPVPPTPTFTPTASGAAALTVELLSAVTTDSTNSPHPFLQVVNTGSGPLNLNNVEVRYWFNCDCTNQTEQAWVDWAGLMPAGTSVTSDILVSVQPTSLGGQTNYVSYKFTGSLVLQAGQMVQIQSRFNKSDWSNMLQDNDWSFAAYTSYTPATKVTAYEGGTLVWGQEPSSASAALKVASVIAYPNPSTGNGVNLAVNLSGNGTGTSASAKDVTGPSSAAGIDPNAEITLKAYTLEGRLIWSTTVTGESFGSTGNHTVYWNERNVAGNYLANGLYIVVATVKSQNQTSTATAKLLILK